LAILGNLPHSTFCDVVHEEKKTRETEEAYFMSRIL
jgi:hypothetical protein